MSVHDEWEESDFLQRAVVALILLIGAWWIAGCRSDVRPIQNARPLVHTLPPASFWICPSESICRASDDTADIPVGYVCISQANKVTVCSPGGAVKMSCECHGQWPTESCVCSPSAPAPAMTKKQLALHLALGAGCYGGLYAIAGSGRQGAVAGSGCALVAGFKEGSDAVAGRDTRKQAVIHAITILAGAGAVAAFKH